MSMVALQGLIDSLETGVKSLRWRPAGTAWGDYYSDHNYSDVALDHKKSLVNEFLTLIQPANVWDLGANVGLFSRLASDRGIPTIAFDIDPGAVEQNYLMIKQKGETLLLPLLQDLTNPSPNLGWHSNERMSFLERAPAGAIMALALIHHLAITNNVPLESLANFFRALSRWLIIEFVPKSDSQVQRLLASREDVFPNYAREHFENTFESYYQIHRKESIHQSERWLYLMEARQV